MPSCLHSFLRNKSKLTLPVTSRVILERKEMVEINNKSKLKETNSTTTTSPMEERK